MLRRFVVAALVVCMPLAASAQNEMRPVPPPARFPGGVVAPRENVTVGITEQGRATIGVPADRLKLVVRSYGSPVAQPGSAGVAMTAASAEDLEKSVVDIMRQNGIADAHIVTNVLGNISANDSIAGTIDKPTHDRVEHIEKRIVAALPSAVLPALRNVNIEGSLEADSCAPALDRARAAAYADARKRAQALATIAGVRLGPLLSANENDQTFGCTDTGTLQGFLGGGNTSLLDVSVQVSVNVNATFEMLP